MYLLSLNALRVLHRTWTGPWRRRATRDPSGRHSHMPCRRQLWRATPLLDTPATRPRSVQSNPLRAWTSNDVLLQRFG